jgi:hypothetical protein
MEKETRAGGLKSHGWILDAILALMVFAVNARLNTPLFPRAEMPYRDSIEGGYSTIARFVAEHPDPWGWNPTAYCGASTQFTYLPALPYLGAKLGWLWNALTPAYAHLVRPGEWPAPPVRDRVALLESYVAAMDDASRPRLAVERDKMGFMVVHVESGESAKIRLHYGGTVEQRAMAAVSALAWIASLVALARNRRQRTVEAV